MKLFDVFEKNYINAILKSTCLYEKLLSKYFDLFLMVLVSIVFLHFQFIILSYNCNRIGYFILRKNFSAFQVK